MAISKHKIRLYEEKPEKSNLMNFLVDCVGGQEDDL